MDKDIKRRWVEALRSGKYTQGKGKLFEDYKNAFCCLGVLCDIQGIPRADIGLYSITPFTMDGVPGFEAIHGVIPDDVASNLAGMNDKGEDFNVIANYIEANL